MVCSGNAWTRWRMREVRVTPGATQFTVTPEGANSRAAERVSPTTAAFALA